MNNYSFEMFDDEIECYKNKQYKTYIIQAGWNGKIKIGKTIDVKRRLRQLQTGNHKKLRILKIFNCDLEYYFKNIFLKFHIFNEWYDDIILNFLYNIGWKNNLTDIIKRINYYLQEIKTDNEKKDEIKKILFYLEEKAVKYNKVK